VIEYGALNFGDGDVFGVGVKGIEQVVEGVGKDGGGDAGEGRALRFEPCVADFAGNDIPDRSKRGG